MNKEILDKLSMITDEEKEILSGKKYINRDLYYSNEDSISRQNEVDASLLLSRGKLIDIRPHTRFVHFPQHTHNFIEFVYMCKGSTKHIIDGQRLTLKEGDLLLMNQHASQEILPADEGDVAINFIIMPQFFDSILKEMDNTNALVDFIVSCLTRRDMGGNYLYYDVSGITPIQNLIENLIWIMLNPPHNKRSYLQATMSLLFMSLMDYTDRIEVPSASLEQSIMIRLLNYIETGYKNATLAELSADCGYDIYSMSRLIKRHFKKSFKDLLIEKRMQQAAFLLSTTKMTIADISLAIGYENTSYFHRTFLKYYGMSPRSFRLRNHSEVT